MVSVVVVLVLNWTGSVEIYNNRRIIVLCIYWNSLVLVKEYSRESTLFDVVGDALDGSP